MWTSDDFPGADHVPWALLIRARFQHQLDAAVASVVLDRVAQVASVDVIRDVATAIKRSGGGKQEPMTAEAHLGGLSAMLEFDDWCGTGWPRTWPPRPKGFEDLSDPVMDHILTGALDLVSRAGSPELQETLGGALKAAQASSF